jgi:hypothetical protein
VAGNFVPWRQARVGASTDCNDAVELWNSSAHAQHARYGGWEAKGDGCGDRENSCSCSAKRCATGDVRWVRESVWLICPVRNSSRTSLPTWYICLRWSTKLARLRLLCRWNCCWLLNAGRAGSGYCAPSCQALVNKAERDQLIDRNQQECADETSEHSQSCHQGYRSCFTIVKAEERDPCKATSASFEGKRLERSTAGI